MLSVNVARRIDERWLAGRGVFFLFRVGACVLQAHGNNSPHNLNPALSRAVEGYRPFETAATAERVSGLISGKVPMPAREVYLKGAMMYGLIEWRSFALALSQPSPYRGGFFVSGPVNRNLERIKCQEVLFVR
jgi:hypothetical protein